MTAVTELLAALFALVAAVFIFDQYLHRPRPYKLMWSLGLLFYGIAAAAAGAAAGSHWSVGEYKTWYFFGGVLTAAFLGLGSFYLLGSRRVSNVLAAIATVIGVYAAVRIAAYAMPAASVAYITHASFLDATATAKLPPNTLPGDITIAVLLMNIPGALFLFGGALWSAYGFYRKHAPGYRLASMALIALGALFPSMGTGLQRLGNSEFAALFELLGAVFLLGGLLISLDVFTVFRVPFTNIVLLERKPATSPMPSGMSAGQP